MIQRFAEILCSAMLAMATVACGNSSSMPRDDTPPYKAPPASDYKEFITWFNQEIGDMKVSGSSYTPSEGGIYKAKVWIKKDLKWLKTLQLIEDVVVVNAANESIIPGGGIDGALFNSVKKIDPSINEWKPVKNPKGQEVTGLKAGEYAISVDGYSCHATGSPVRLYLYHAVGPRASETSNLQEAQSKVETLYYNMLLKAEGTTTMKSIVLPAISTAIFAGGGSGFTKKEFIKAMYLSMYRGIKRFREKNPKHRIRVVLNNFTPPAA